MCITGLTMIYNHRMNLFFRYHRIFNKKSGWRTVYPLKEAKKYAYIPGLMANILKTLKTFWSWVWGGDEMKANSAAGRSQTFRPHLLLSWQNNSSCAWSWQDKVATAATLQLPYFPTYKTHCYKSRNPWILIKFLKKSCIGRTRLISRATLAVTDSGSKCPCCRLNAQNQSFKVPVERRCPSFRVLRRCESVSVRVLPTAKPNLKPSGGHVRQFGSCRVGFWSFQCKIHDQINAEPQQKS